jgi:hypothetical protein
MDKPTIRIVDTSAHDLAHCNVEHLVRVFGKISQLPGKAKLLRGLVFLGFPSVEDDPRLSWAIPEVRQFVRKLDGEMPHFCYFLTGEVPFGFLRTYMLCLLDINPDGSVQPQAFDPLVRRLEKDVRAFCDTIADRPDPVIERIMMNLPARIVHNVPALRRAALRTLLPVLEAIVKAPDAPDQLKGPAFREAADLLGTTVPACGSEETLVARVREEAGRKD